MLPLRPVLAAPLMVPLTEEEMKLHAQYIRLCAEKRRMLSSIEGANRECRALRHEIHRLLDFAGELVYSDEDEDDDEDVAAILRTLDEEVDDSLYDAAPAGTWLQEVDAEDAALAEERSVQKMEELRASLRAAQNGQRRAFRASDRSPSPSRNRRDYKNLPTLENGGLSLPVILGRGVHRTVLLQVGTVTPGGAFVRGDYTFPVGLRIRRKYHDFDHSPVDGKASHRRYYQCTVRMGPDEMKPLFEISAGSFQSGMEDGADPLLSPVADYCDQDTDLDALWQRFQACFVPSGRARLLEDFGTPEVFFGLNHDSLAKHIREQSSLDNS